LKSYIPLNLDRIYIVPLNLPQSLFAPLYYIALKTTTIEIANEPKSSLITMSIISLVREQLTIIQQSFIDALAQQQAVLEAQHQRLIEALRKELRNI